MLSDFGSWWESLRESSERMLSQIVFRERMHEI